VNSFGSGAKSFRRSGTVHVIPTTTARVSMRQVRDVSRLKYVCGRSGYQIAGIVGVSLYRVAEYLRPNFAAAVSQAGHAKPKAEPASFITFS